MDQGIPFAFSIEFFRMYIFIEIVFLKLIKYILNILINLIYDLIVQQICRQVKQSFFFQAIQNIKNNKLQQKLLSHQFFINQYFINKKDQQHNINFLPITINFMKSVPYSPFNRTYKYLCLQNQLAHNRNKKSVKGLVDSNLVVPDVNLNLTDTWNSQNYSRYNKNSSMISSRSMGNTINGKLKQQPLIIHKNSKIDTRKQLQRQLQNSRISRKLSQTKCRIIPYKSTQKDYNNVTMYKQIAKRYDKFDKNKQLVCFPQHTLTQSWTSSDPHTKRYLCRSSSRKNRY